MEQYRSYTDPQDENDVTNKRYVDNNVHNIDKKIDDQIKKVENDIDNRFKKSLGNIIVDSIENKNIFNVDLALLFYGELCNARIIEDGIRVISNSDTTNDVYAIYRTIDLRGLEGKQLVLSYKTRSNKSVASSLGGIELFYENAAGNDRTLIEWNATNGFSFQVKDDLGNNHYLAMTFFANRSGNQIYNNEYVDYYDIQIEEGEIPTNFVPYKKYGYNNKESMGSIVVDDINCKNLFNKNNVLIGNFINLSGVQIASENMCMTNYYIEVNPNTEYTFSSNVVNYLYIAEYNSSKEFIKSTGVDGTDKEITITTDIGTKYVIASCSKHYLDGMQFEEGNTATNYSEYKGIGYTSGQNANGKWVKYDDGRMECWGVNSYNNVEVKVLDITEYYAQLPAQPFPQAFVRPPICVMSIDNVQPGYALQLKSTGNGATGTHTPMTLAFCAVSATATRIDVHYHAIGRWK